MRPSGFKHTTETKKKIAQANTRFGHFAKYNKTRSSLPGYVNPMKGKKRLDLSERNKNINRNNGQTLCICCHNKTKKQNRTV